MDNIPDIERHPWEPFLPESARVLFLGSFPPPKKRWSMDFFYPNWINDHWRIEGQIFFDDRNHFLDMPDRAFRRDLIESFLIEKGIGLYDTATAVRRLKDNASDKFLEVVEPTDIAALVRRAPHLRVIVTTGEKATETICETLHINEMPKVNQHVEIDLRAADIPPRETPLCLYRLPSSSRAYPLSFDKKVEAYQTMFRFAEMI